MKQFIIIISFATLMVACKNGNNKDAQKAAMDTANYTTIRWVDSIVQFGTINKGEKIKINFRFKNTGNKPLILTNVKPGCGCTIADYTKEPVMPGAEGLVTASFNTEHINQPEVRKTIIVNTNTTNGTEHYLYFEGKINGVESNDKIVQPHPVDTKKL